MRWDRIREGLLAAPGVPGATTDLRPVVKATPPTRNVLEAIGPDQAQSFLQGPQSFIPPQPPGPVPRSPALHDALGGLSNIVQGKEMDIMVPSTPAEGIDPDDSDLPPPPNPGAANDMAEAMKMAPLQTMKPADPSYGDLFKKLRPR